MSPSIRAIVTSNVLRWAREQLDLSITLAAKRVGTSEAKVASWEEGSALPTLRQARELARLYRQPFAAFFLPSPPPSKIRIPRDYRRLAGTTLQLSPSIRAALLEAGEKREIALDLLSMQESRPPNFAPTGSLDESAEVVGGRLRESLKVTVAEQTSWKSARRGLNEWRSKVERLGVLVLQTSEAEVAELRAFSLYEQPLPVIVVNRKDVPAARSFSLIHECAHLTLHAEGLCDLTTDSQQNPELQRIEVFCNAVAAACLMPEEAVRAHQIVWHHDLGLDWSDDQIVQLANAFTVSREALLRRLLTLNLTTPAFYERKRRQYHEEYQARPQKPGFMPPATDAVSSLGKPYVRLVLTTLNSGQITPSDASDYLGLRLKHLPAVSAALTSE